MTKACRGCGTQNDDSARFCKLCSANISALPAPPSLPSDLLNCLACATANAASAEFCRKCGEPLALPVNDETLLMALPYAAGSDAEPTAPLVDVRARTAAWRGAAPWQDSASTSAPQMHPSEKPEPPASAGTVAASPQGMSTWVAVVLAALAVIGGAGYWSTQREAAPAPSAPPAMAPAPIVAAPAAAQPPAEAAPVEPIVTAPPETPLPVAAAPAPVKAAPKSPLTAKQKSKPEPAPVVAAQAAAAPAPAVAEVPAPVAEPAPAPSGPSSPQEACADRTIFTRALCVLDQCNSARFAALAQCVKLREEERERAERRRNPG